MTVSRRNFLGNAAALGLLSSLLAPEVLSALQQQNSQAAASAEEAPLPHSSYDFWAGFYDPVDPQSPAYGQKGAGRGADSLADPALETQYLHYKADEKKLRYANSIAKSELLSHDGDVAVSILLDQFRPGSADARNKSASQLRVDTTQNYPFMNILAPLAWTALASLEPNKAGQIPSLDQLHFKSDQVMSASSHILLTKGSGSMAINISRAAHDSAFLKALNAMIQGAKMAAPFVALPAVSTPAMSAFSEAFGYWENRTQFLINGNLVGAYATQSAMEDPQIKSPAIGLIPGEYVVVAKKDTATLEAAMPNLMVYQGYLVSKQADLSQISVDEAKADPRVPDITYATVKVGVTAVNSSLGTQPAPQSAADSSVNPSSSSGKSKGKSK